MTDEPQHPQVVINTSYGRITVELYPERTPDTVENFLAYVDDHFYDHTLFHRVIDNFLVQGGGFEPGMIQKTTRPPIRNESKQGLRNERGTIAMARLPADPHSATSQFFINTRDNETLNYSGDGVVETGYCAFGRVTEGMEVVERIEGVATRTVNDHQDVPIKEILIESVEQI